MPERMLEGVIMSGMLCYSSSTLHFDFHQEAASKSHFQFPTCIICYPKDLKNLPSTQNNMPYIYVPMTGSTLEIGGFASPHWWRGLRLQPVSGQPDGHRGLCGHMVE